MAILAPYYKEGKEIKMDPYLDHYYRLFKLGLVIWAILALIFGVLFLSEGWGGHSLL